MDTKPIILTAPAFEDFRGKRSIVGIPTSNSRS